MDASVGRMGPLPKRWPTVHSHASMLVRSLRQGLSQRPLFCSARKASQAVFGLLPSRNACASYAVAVIRLTTVLRLRYAEEHRLCAKRGGLDGPNGLGSSADTFGRCHIRVSPRLDTTGGTRSYAALHQQHSLPPGRHTETGLVRPGRLSARSL